LGHASLSTTSAYVTTEDRQRMAAVQKFARRRQVVGPDGDGRDS